MLKEWRGLLTSMTNKADEICRLKPNATVIEFRSHVLNDNPISWTSDLVFIVKNSLVMPLGSADAERGFSIMNNIKSSKRASLEHKSIDGLMRIKINGPAVERFDANKYTAKWVQENHLLSDDDTKRGKPKKVIIQKVFVLIIFNLMTT